MWIFFEPIESPKSEHPTKIMLEMVETLGLEVKNCPGQYFDIAANLSGK
jgi:hypothetical protein